MRTILFCIITAIMVVSCDGTSTSGADTSLTVDQIAGIWKMEDVIVLEDTCEIPEMDPEDEEGTYSYLEKVDESQVKVYDCDTDASCANKTPVDTYAYSKGKITVPGSTEDLFNEGNCRAYLDIPTTYAIFSSATAAAMTMSSTIKFEGDCDAIKAMNAEDPNHPDKTVGDYENCRIKIKRVMAKQ